MPVKLTNDFRGHGLPGLTLMPADDPTPVQSLLARCPRHAQTPLTEMPALARTLGVAAVCLKDERSRMELGSFKALGAAYAIAKTVQNQPEGTCQTFVTASAGNHGLSLAAGAQAFGQKAIIYLATTVPEAFADRLRSLGADVVRAGDTYEKSMAAAEARAASDGLCLLSDSSWPGYHDMPYLVMEGYLQMAAEIADQMHPPPTDILLQAGVGGLAAAVAAHARHVWGDAPRIIVIEPEAAPALMDSIAKGKITDTEGPVSNMGRLDCKTPSMIALNGLARDADLFLLISDDEAQACTDHLAKLGIASTPSGTAGLAGAFSDLIRFDSDARILAIISEGPEDG
jgi:diaminopropionate ammonia-lyase